MSCQRSRSSSLFTLRHVKLPIPAGRLYPMERVERSGGHDVTHRQLAERLPADAQSAGEAVGLLEVFDARRQENAQDDGTTIPTHDRKGTHSGILLCSSKAIAPGDTFRNRIVSPSARPNDRSMGSPAKR